MSPSHLFRLDQYFGPWFVEMNAEPHRVWQQPRLCLLLKEVSHSIVWQRSSKKTMQAMDLNKTNVWKCEISLKCFRAITILLNKGQDFAQICTYCAMWVAACRIHTTKRLGWGNQQNLRMRKNRDPGKRRMLGSRWVRQPRRVYLQPLIDTSQYQLWVGFLRTHIINIASKSRPQASTKLSICEAAWMDQILKV